MDQPDTRRVVTGRMKTLAEYEDQLKENLSAVTLVGQLPYDDSDLIVLREALRPLFAVSAGNGLKAMKESYCLVFVLYLVMEGIYGYTGGDYWTGPGEVLKLTAPNHKADVGRLYRATLRRLSLPTFESIGGHVNLAPILAHGGIPNFCLDDFFALLDWAERNRAAADAPTLMDEWARDGFRVNIDRPVQRFLLHGGDIAEEFVERCLILLREEGDPESLDLPARVLERYEDWRRKNPMREKGRKDFRLGRPKLVYDPFGEGVAIVLPPILYRAGKAPERVVWRITANERRREEETWRRRLSDEVEFTPRAAAVNVLTVSPSYEVVALADGAPLQTWTLPGLADPPLLAFDRASGELLPDRQQDTTKEYWISPGEPYLVYPRGWATGSDGARKLAELPDPGGEWSDYIFESWVVEPDGRLDMSAPDGRRVAFRARNDPPPAQPYLDGDPLIAPGTFGRFALYNGRPPLLRIPPARAAHNPAKWRITITPVGKTDPPTPRAFSLADLPQHCVILDDHVLLSLDAPELLGPSPVGEFHIHLRGPYGRKGDFVVGFAPGLRFEQDPPLHLALGDDPTRFRVAHAAGFGLKADDLHVTLGPVESIYPTETSRTVTAAAERTLVSLRLEAEARGSNPNDDRPALAFDLPVYRLRFGLVEPEQPDRFKWATTSLRVHPDALDATHTALLRADLPRPPDMPPQSIGWRLETLDGRPLRETPPRRMARYPQTGLAEWLDTFHNEGSPAVLRLVVVDDESDQETTIDIARLMPTLELGQVETVWHTGNSGDHLVVLWEEATSVRNRQLRLWPVDRPWAIAPHTLPVPDEADGLAEWDLPSGALPPGDYVAEMVIHDPWNASEPARPAPHAPNIFALRPDDMDAALEAALARARRDELSAEDALVWVLFLTRTRVGEAIARFNISLWRDRSSLSLEQLLLWASATRGASDETAYRIAQKALFESPRIVELIKQPDDLRDAYLGHLPGGLDVAVYRVLLRIATGEPRHLCLENLCRMGDEVGLQALLDDFRLKRVRIREAVEWLSPIARQATDHLYSDGSQSAKELLRALRNIKPDDRYIAKGDSLWTNVGQVRVTGIRNSQTQDPVDICINNGEHFLLQGKLWPGESDLPVQIDLQNQTVQILKSPVYPCCYTGKPQCDYVYANPGELKRHYRQKHKMDSSDIQQKFVLKINLTYLSFLSPDGNK